MSATIELIGILLMIVNLVMHSSSFHSHSLYVFIPSWTLYKRRRFQVICLLTDVSSERREREREELWGRNVLPLSNHFLYLESLRLTIDFDWKGKEKRGRRRMKKSSWERRNDFFLLPCVTKNGEKESRRTLRQEERERKWKKMKEVERKEMMVKRRDVFPRKERREWGGGFWRDHEKKTGTIVGTLDTLNSVKEKRGWKKEGEEERSHPLMGPGKKSDNQLDLLMERVGWVSWVEK